jgi:Tfp pilus assembly protein PilX
MSNSKQNGYIALMTVLILGAVATAIAVALLVTGTDSSRSAIVTQQSIAARHLAQACAEEALQSINDFTSYVGTGNLSYTAGTCTYTVTNTGGATRTITSTGTVNGVVKKLTIYATIGSSTISITSWQETT